MAGSSACGRQHHRSGANHIALGVARTEMFHCSISVNSNDTGSAFCPLDPPAPGAPAVETFDFVLSGNGKIFRKVGTFFR